MKKLVCEEPGTIRMTSGAIPAARKNGVLLQIERVGICGTDFHAYRGRQPFFHYPRILGHELSATVADGADGLKTGTRVVIIPYLHCGACGACRRGLTNCCQHLQVLGVHIDGGMQELLPVPGQFLIPVEGLSADHAALVEPLSIGYHGVQRAGLMADELTLVAGCGPIGIATAFFALRSGARVIITDISTERLEKAASMLPGCVATPASEIKDVIAGISEEGVNVAFDATGNANVMEKLPSYGAPGGRIVLVGLTREVIGFSHPEIHAREMTILCSRNATRHDFEQVIGCLQANEFPADAYITERLAADEIPGIMESLADARDNTVKIITIWDQEK